LAAFLGSLSLSKAYDESNPNATVVEMQQDAVQHLAEIEATDDDDNDAEEEKELTTPVTREMP
tara:strand:+ start:74 stop:262 length:189 start_codon:yes stop_codon:yes gene_type:complete